MSERHGVEIDYCPKCRGVWLDRGELDKVIDKAAPPIVQREPQPAPPPEPPREWREPYSDDLRQGDPRYDPRAYKHAKPYKRKKRKSILSEIFDIID